MDYSSIFFDLRKNNKRNGKFTACWLAATSKDFYGTGPRKLSKSEIEKVDIASICDEILDDVDTDTTNNLKLPCKLTLGALKILEKQVDFLKEKCEDVFNRLTVLKQISTLPKKTSELNELYDQEINDIDLKSLFHTPKKKHLLSEEDYQLPTFLSWEWKFCNDDEMSLLTSEITSVPTALEGPTEQLLTPKGTPKRKSYKSHSDTPSKRPRKDKDAAPSSSKITEATTHSTSEQPSSSKARISISPQSQTRRRSLFPTQHPHQEPSAADIHDEQGIPPIEPSEHIPRVTITDEEPMDQSVPQGPEVLPPQREHAVPPLMESHEMPIDHAVTDNVQNATPAVIQEDREDDLAMPLPELTGDSFLERSRRSRTRKFVVFDVEKKIDIAKNLENANTQNNYDKIRSIQVHFPKVPAKMLLSLPSVQIKLETRRDKIRCSWGKTLAAMFLESIEASRLDVTREFGESELRRDAYINKDRRRTTFTSQRKSAISSTSESAKSIQQSEHDVYANADDVYQDPMLFPPPQPPLEEDQLLSTSGRDHQAQTSYGSEQQPRPITQQGENGLQSSSTAQLGEHEHQPSPMAKRGERGLQASPIVQREHLQHPSPHTPRLDHRQLDSSYAASPQQRGRPSGADVPQQGPRHASDSPIAAHFVMDNTNIQGAQLSSPRLSEHFSESMSIEYRKYFMTKEEFGDFLEKIWTILRNISYFAELTFDLEVILVPNESACEEVIVYFNYLCVFEKEKKLHIKQDDLYGTVAIAKRN